MPGQCQLLIINTVQDCNLIMWKLKWPITMRVSYYKALYATRDISVKLQQTWKEAKAHSTNRI